MTVTQEPAPNSERPPQNRSPHNILLVLFPAQFRYHQKRFPPLRCDSDERNSVFTTKHGGHAAFESADGKFIYYTKTSDSGIWKVQVDGGQESSLFPQIHLQQWNNWALTDNGVFFLNEESARHPVIKFFDFSAARIRDVAMLEGRVPWRSWISASADGKFVLYPQNDQDESNIMLLENFR